MRITTYTANGTWSGGALGAGEGSLDFGPIKTIYSAPKDLGGKGVGTNPEEMMVGAASGCFLITLGTVLRLQNVRYRRLEVASEGDFERTEKGPRMRQIRHYATIFVDVMEDVGDLARHLQEAEEGCMVGAATSGNVLVRVSGTVVIDDPIF